MFSDTKNHMNPEQKYQLVMWFDQKQAGINELFRFVNAGLSEKVEKKVGYSTEGYLTLSLEGSLEDVDKAHSQVIEFTQKISWNLFRLIDTAGDEIRHQAYSELSKIEQELRVFINRGLIEAFSFDWWLSLGSLKIPGLANVEFQKTNHRLELMTIEELIDFVTFEKSEWGDENPVLLRDLIDLVDGCNSFDEFRIKLSQKARNISLWDLVFSKYLGENAHMWQEIRKDDLQFVIGLRNKVMHHRPVRLGELITLGEKRKKISSFFASAKTYLSEDEKSEIASLQKDARDIFAQLLYERSPQNTFGRLYASLMRSRNTNTVRNLVKEIDALVATGGLNAKESLELKALSFDRLQTLTNYNLVETQMIILDELLPLCLYEDAELSMQYHAFRNILVDWISNHQQQDFVDLRDLILDRLAELIGSNEHKTACWVISRLGFGREDIVQKLLDYVRNTDEISGDDTLYSLTALTCSPEQRMIMLDELHQRATKRYNNSLAWSIAQLKDISSISVILSEWLQANNRSGKLVDASMSFTALRYIADANDGNTEIQEDIWNFSKEVVEQSPKELYWEFDIGHQIIGVNSTRVIPTILRWHGKFGNDWFENPSWARYLMQDRLEKCIKPQQLSGWHHIDIQEIYDILRKDACSDTGQDLLVQTHEAIQKKAAWETLLRSGYEPALSWFDDAVVTETGRFLKQEIMELLACFRIDPLPAQVMKWITEVYDHPGNSDGREFFRMAAVRIACSTASREGFEALVNFGFTYNQKVILQSSDAVAEVAVALMRQGNQEVIDFLVELIERSDISRQRIVCAHALEILASFPEFSKRLLEQVGKIIPLLNDEKRELLERGTLLNFLANLSGWKVEESLLQNLLAWSQKPDEWIGGGSLRVLVFHNLMENYPDLMRSKLGIEKSDHGFQMVDGIELSQWIPHLIGRLYYSHPEGYAEVVAHLMLDRNWHPSVQILRWLKITHTPEKQTPIPIVVLNALLRRVREYYSLSYGETEVLEALSLIAPDALVDQEWDSIIDKWIADSQVSLANALGNTICEIERKFRCFSHLEKLAESGTFAVRRAAYRALANQSQEHLYQLCKSWSGSSVLNIRTRAAEAMGWIEYTPEKADQDGYSEIFEIFSIDPEPMVRNAAQRAWEERRGRLWAHDYLEILLRIEGGTNQEILDAWCYGDALSQIGDDDCQKILRQHLTNRVLPPNVRFWLGRILKQMEMNWKKITQKWPEPWIDMKGMIETGTGELILEKEHVSIQYSIWGKMGAVPGDKHSWGGIVIAPVAHFIDLDKATIELSDKRKGEIVMNGFSGDTASFIGTGEYPA
jgi:hypothetical protein